MTLARHSAIRARRATNLFNLLDRTYLRDWKADYDEARADFIRGAIDRVEFISCLEALGYRLDALKAEVRDAERDKSNPTYVMPAPQPRYFRYEAV